MSKFYFLFLLLPFGSLAQEVATPFRTICYASEMDAFTQVLRPDGVALRREPTSNIEVTYNNFPNVAKVAFNEAIQIWEDILISNVPIKINATWETMSGNTLAFSGATRIFRNFDNAPYFDVWYVGPLAEAISGKELNNNEFDIYVTLNSNINWSYATTGAVFTGKYDLITVVLHEIAHGLGFSSSFKLINNKSEGQWGQSGFPYIYDTFLENGDEKVLTDFENYFNPSEELQQEVISDNLFFQVSNVNFIDNLPKIFSPNPFSLGGSISHLDESEYPPGSEHSLMSPNIRAAEAVHKPGDLILSVLNELGWPVNNLNGSLILSESPASEPEILVYPNPSVEKIAVAIPITLRAKETKVVLFDNNGKAVLSFKRNTDLEPTFYFSVADLASGLYLLSVSSEKGEVVKRVLKN